MALYPSDRTALFIDGPNLYSATRAAGFQLDYTKLLKYFQKHCKLVRAYYYTALPEDKDEKTRVKPLADWLGFNGFQVITRGMRADDTGQRRYIGSMAVDLAVDAMELAPRLDHAILFTGNGDFVHLVAALQRAGVQVTICSTKKGEIQVASDDLRKQSDSFIDLVDLAAHIGREEGSSERSPAMANS